MFVSCGLPVTFKLDFNCKIVICHFLQRLPHWLLSSSLDAYVHVLLFCLLWSFIIGNRAGIAWQDICSVPFPWYLLVLFYCFMHVNVLRLFWSLFLLSTMLMASHLGHSSLGQNISCCSWWSDLVKRSLSSTCPTSQCYIPS